MLFPPFYLFSMLVIRFPCGSVFALQRSVSAGPDPWAAKRSRLQRGKSSPSTTCTQCHRTWCGSWLVWCCCSAWKQKGEPQMNMQIQEYSITKTVYFWQIFCSFKATIFCTFKKPQINLNLLISFIMHSLFHSFQIYGNARRYTGHGISFPITRNVTPPDFRDFARLSAYFQAYIHSHRDLGVFWSLNIFSHFTIYW